MLGATLPLTPEAADLYGEIVAARRMAGRPIAALDALVGAVCLDTGAVLATRDESDFAGLGIRVVNPFSPPSTPSASA